MKTQTLHSQDGTHVVTITTPPDTNYRLECVCGWAMNIATLDSRKPIAAANEHLDSPLRCTECAFGTTDTPDMICWECKQKALQEIEQANESDRYTTGAEDDMRAFEEMLERNEDEQERGL